MTLPPSASAVFFCSMVCVVYSSRLSVRLLARLLIYLACLFHVFIYLLSSLFVYSCRVEVTRYMVYAISSSELRIIENY